MILSFLEKNLEELTGEQIELKEELDFILSQIKERKRYIEILQSTNNTYQSDFSPRVQNQTNLEKLADIQNELEELYHKKENLELKIENASKKIKEIKNLILLENNRVINNNTNNYKQNNNLTKTSNDNIVIELKKITSYILNDPCRAKIELENIIKKLD